MRMPVDRGHSSDNVLPGTDPTRATQLRLVALNVRFRPERHLSTRSNFQGEFLPRYARQGRGAICPWDSSGLAALPSGALPPRFAGWAAW